MNYDSWLSTCREYKRGDSAIPEHVLESAPDRFDVVHVFDDGAWIFETNNNYWSMVSQFEIDTGSFEEATRFLWDNHSKYEARAKDKPTVAADSRYIMRRETDGRLSVLEFRNDEFADYWTAAQIERFGRALPVERDGVVFADMAACTAETMQHWSETP